MAAATAMSVVATAARHRDSERVSAGFFLCVAVALYMGLSDGGFVTLLSLGAALLSYFAPPKGAAPVTRMDIKF